MADINVKDKAFKKKCRKTSFWLCSPSSVVISFQFLVSSETPVFLTSECLLCLNQEHNSNLSFLQHHRGVCAALWGHLPAYPARLFPSHCSSAIHNFNCKSASLGAKKPHATGKGRHRFDFLAVYFSSLVPLWKVSLSFLLGLEPHLCNILWPVFRMTYKRIILFESLWLVPWKLKKELLELKQAKLQTIMTRTTKVGRAFLSLEAWLQDSGLAVTSKK